MDTRSEENVQKNGIYKKFKSSVSRHPVFLTICVLFIISIVVYIISRFHTGFAEFWARNMSVGIRYITAMLTAIFPFSIAETLILLLPLGIAVTVWVSLRLSFKNEKRRLSKLVLTLVSILMIVCILFGLGFGPCYFRNSLADNLNLTDKPVSAESLYNTAVWLTESINEVIPYVSFSSEGESHMPYSFSMLSSVVNEAFNDFAAEYDFISSFSCPVKMLALSDAITYTHVSGIYSFFTGEANINVNYPDFITPFTVAHEMSHQRGIAREDEANFVAFLVCVQSDDAYMRYSGYLNVLREVMSALYKADKDLYAKYRNSYYPDKLAGEISAYSKFFDKYRDSTAAKVVSGTNDAYLSSQKVKAGVKSYGLVTDLAVAYYETNIENK
ncbi:MAG: DUF3810 domain-containing protein [Eubacteriales bacterium]|nr:DUF3810 domain-containing protein [Eubacteriales bacterium]